MLRPIPSKIAANLTKKNEELQLLDGEAAATENAEKLKLATSLHTQGISPERWTEAQPAGWAVQKAFQDTGRKPDEQHFEVNGRLYKSGLHVAANQAQGQDAIDVYLGAAPKPVDQLIDITKVPLKYPFGRPHEARDDRPDAHALNLHYARMGVDPASAHNGDPLPMDQQPKLQQATRAPDGTEIPLGIPGIYRGYDDGFFYAANEGTKESTEVQALRRKLAEEKATTQGDAAAMVANDNDPEIDEAVARSYQQKNPSESPAKLSEKPVVSTEESASIPSRLPMLISAIEKKQNDQLLSKDEEAILEAVDTTFSDAGAPIDINKVDIARLKTVAEAEQKKLGEKTEKEDKSAATSETMTPVITGATAALPALGGVGQFFASARAAAAAVPALIGDVAIGATALSAAGFAALVGGFTALMTSSTQTQEQEDEDLRQAAMQRAAAQASTSAAQPDSLLRKLLLANYQTYISLVAKLRKGEILTEEETKLSKEINSTIDQDTNEIALADVKLSVANIATAEQPNIPGQIINDGIAIIPSIKKWLLNLLRGKPDDRAKPDCNEVFKHCQGLCIDMVVNEPHNLPGEGSDKSGRYVRCVRECMEAHDCFDY